MTKTECNTSKEIDIVLPWVNGNDPEWRKCKAEYENNSQADSSEERYRDWELLKYVFRGIEQNLPWIRKVHFVTWGHLPEWLNTDFEKINIVNHKDYIPEKYLPTFSANPIELNIHRINNLSEKFIYINDDFFFMDKMSSEDFFQKGLPCSQAGLCLLNESNNVFNGILFENKKVINRNFNSKTIIRKNLWMFINHKYGIKSNFKTMLLLPFCVGFFPSFAYLHGPNAYLKSTFEKIWEKEESTLDEVCTHKFRQFNDVNQYLMLWWQWCEGKFIPSSIQKKIQYIDVSRSKEQLISAITDPVAPMLCINDAKTDGFEEKKATMIKAFENRFPAKSRFEN